jgi:hypothetical protein
VDQRDQRLLDKQFCWLSSTYPNVGVVALTMMTLFVGGVLFGGALFPPERSPVHLGTSVAETEGPPSPLPIMIAARSTGF